MKTKILSLLSSVCFLSSIFLVGVPQAYALGLEEIRKDFYSRVSQFKANDGIVDKIDRCLKVQHKVPNISDVPREALRGAYAQIFAKNTGNCRVASAYFANQFDACAIENKELHVGMNIDEEYESHTCNLYKIGDDWFVADFTLTKVKNHFEIPLIDYVRLFSGTITELAVYLDHTTVDFREFFPDGLCRDLESIVKGYYFEIDGQYLVFDVKRQYDVCNLISRTFRITFDQIELAVATYIKYEKEFPSLTQDEKMFIVKVSALKQTATSDDAAVIQSLRLKKLM